MPVPQNRLLAAVAFGLVPLAALAGVWPQWQGAAAALGAFGFVVVSLDAWLGARRPAAVGIEFPEVVRLSKDRAGNLPFSLRNDRAGEGSRVLRLGLALPPGLETPDEELSVRTAAGRRRTHFEWPCTARRRGRFVLDEAYGEESSPLGLWLIRSRLPVSCEVRVYPDLLAERRHAAAMFLHRGGLGLHPRRQVGRGREFEQLRDYVPGDSIEDISWKATARRRRPISKVFQVERTQEVYVVIDSSRLSSRLLEPAGGAAARAATILERCVTSALLLGVAAQRQGDLFGLVTFAGQIGHFVRASTGRAHFDACREAIHSLEPSMVSPDFDELCAFLRVRLRRRALLVFLTSLDDPVIAEQFTRQIQLISRQHLVLVNMVRAQGVGPLFSDRAEVSTNDDVYRQLAGHLRWQKLHECEGMLRRHGVQFALVDHDRMTGQLVSQYAGIKQRQIL